MKAFIYFLVVFVLPIVLMTILSRAGKSKKCRDCGGHGVFKIDGVPYACSNCQGTGEVK